MEDYAHVQTSNGLTPKQNSQPALSQHIDDFDKRLAQLAVRTKTLAERVAGLRPEPVCNGEAGQNSNGPVSLLARANGLRHLIGSCEASLDRIEAAIG